MFRRRLSGRPIRLGLGGGGGKLPMARRYDRTYAILAQRAVKQGTLNLETLILSMLDSGMTQDAIREALDNDLKNDGPVFGAFVRSLTDASTSAITVAGSQGETLGMISGDAELQRLVKTRGLKLGIDEAIESGDPEIAAEFEDAIAEDIQEMRIATLINTCHLCLPLHGKTMSRADWVRLGLMPADMHPETWNSRCMCKNIPVSLAGKRKDVIAPLRRLRVNKGDKRTVRVMTAIDIDKAIEARNQAMESIEGRRVLRRLGSVKG